MRILAASVLFTILLHATSAWAFCNPRENDGVSCATGPDTSCEIVGTTTLDADQKNIIACLNNDTGATVWKQMTRSEDAAPYAAAKTRTDCKWYRVPESPNETLPVLAKGKCPSNKVIVAYTWLHEIYCCNMN